MGSNEHLIDVTKTVFRRGSGERAGGHPDRDRHRGQGIRMVAAETESKQELDLSEPKSYPQEDLDLVPASILYVLLFATALTLAVQCIVSIDLYLTIDF